MVTLIENITALKIARIRADLFSLRSFLFWQMRYPLLSSNERHLFDIEIFFTGISTTIITLIRFDYDHIGSLS